MKRFLFLFLLLPFVFFFQCGDDDDDDNDDSGTEDDDDTVDDDDTIDDDDNDDNDDGDDDDMVENLPACDPFAENPRWITWSEDPSDIKGTGEYDTGTVAWSGDEFTIDGAEDDLSGEWLTDGVFPPMTDGQSVFFKVSKEAGDDGCCDTLNIYIWDQSWNLLVFYSWNSGMTNYSFDEGAILIEGDSEFEQVCEYQEGQRPNEGEADWIQVNGLAVSGNYGTSTYSVDAPSADLFTSGDGQFAVHWPIGYKGSVPWDNDQVAITHFWQLEVVAQVD